VNCKRALIRRSAKVPYELTVLRFQNNARRDNVGGFWNEVYGRNHALMVVSGFYRMYRSIFTSVASSSPTRKRLTWVLQFNPRPVTEMLVACLWDHWSGPSAADLWSFAAVTDEPPPEIAATGHQRCIIALREPNLREWLVRPQDYRATA
jgi:putative SOS response-associated peptidase YedK